MGIINEKDAETVETNIEDFNLKDFVNVQQALEDRIKQFNLIRDVYGNDYKKLYRRESLSPMGNRLNLAIPDVGVSRNVIMFGSNNYQAMAGNHRVRQAMKQAVDDYGVGGGGSPLLCGTSTMHSLLERNMASFKGKDECILFSSGYAAQQGWMKALLDKNDIIFMDAYSHTSFNEGLAVTGVKRVPFRHNNLDDLERKLKAFRKRRRTAWIFVEGVYSMHGDTVDLRTVVELSKKYDCKIAVDDAHGVGVLGATGRGIEEHCGVDPNDITISMGTFSKAFGAVGGYVCTSSFYSDYMRYMAKSHMFSASIPSPVAAAINEALNILREEPERAGTLHDKVAYLVQGLNRAGIHTSSQSAIVPIAIPMGANARELAVEYDREDIFLNLVDYPAVPLDQQRFRATVIVSHTKEDLDRLIEVTHTIFSNNGLI
ncbi:MAG: pyridoxal phosphate-dependent aminotransferase family protein [Ketobacter sp.]|nr:MAG: pyridoxal phosphate-dependent aminotransferase family protein [Ketobacter sp.]